jgi:hypothetical protein
MFARKLEIPLLGQAGIRWHVRTTEGYEQRVARERTCTARLGVAKAVVMVEQIGSED